MASAYVERSLIRNHESPLPKKLRCSSWTTSSSANSTSCRKRCFMEDSQSLSPSPSAAKKICFRDNRDIQVDVSRQRSSHPTSKEEWVELLIKEMMGATSIDDAKSRAAMFVDHLEKLISTMANARAETEAAACRSLQERIETMSKENCILKKGIAIQHQRQKEYDDRSQEVKQLKDLAANYQEKARTLEVNNYALTIHLQQALHSNPISNRFHPHVF